MWYLALVSWTVSLAAGVLAFGKLQGQPADVAEMVCYLAGAVGVLSILAGLIRRPPSDGASAGLFG